MAPPPGVRRRGGLPGARWPGYGSSWRAIFPSTSWLRGPDPAGNRYRALDPPSTSSSWVYLLFARLWRFESSLPESSQGFCQSRGQRSDRLSSGPRADKKARGGLSTAAGVSFVPDRPGERAVAGPGRAGYFLPFFAGFFAAGFVFGAAFTTFFAATLAFGAPLAAFTGFVAAFVFGVGFAAFFGAGLAFEAAFAAAFGAGFGATFADFAALPDTLAPSRTAAWPAARRAMGIRNGEQLT